jgi:hypothetical protein
MIPELFALPSEQDLPPGQLESRRLHLVAEIAALPPRPRPGRLVLAPIAVVAAALALLLVAPRESRGPSVVDRALAAVGAGPVVHAVVEYSWPQDVLVDLRTGAEREQVHRAEYWYDDQRDVLRYRSWTDENEAADYVASVDVGLDPSLAGFVTRYRHALERGGARVVGEAIVGGRPAKRIQFAPRIGIGAVEEVTVDAETFVPLRFHTTYPPNGRRSPEWRVVTIESLPRDPADFRPVEPVRTWVTTGEVSAGEPISLAEAARALGQAPLWLGKSFSGRSLGSVELDRTRAWLSDGSEVTGVVVRLAYGRVRLSLSRDRAAGWDNPESPMPPPGAIAINGNRYGWQGKLRQGGFAITLSALRKEEVLTAAKALRPQR